MVEALSDIELLTRLIAFDTTSSTAQPTVPLSECIAEYVDGTPVRLERFDCGAAQENLVLTAGPECVNGEGLLLSGHVDCVPALEPEWMTDPFVLDVQDDRLVGRGACDMKGFVAIAVNVLRREALAGSLAEGLMLLLSCNEEIGTIGAGAFVDQWGDRPLPRRCVVGEPTSLRPIRGHKGHTSYTITLAGVGGHSGFPNEGVNAIERATPVLQALADVRAELALERSEWSDLFPEVPFPVLSIAQINGGSAINVTPESCTIRVGVRPLPGEAIDAYTSRLQAVLPDDAHLELTNGTPSFGAPADNEFLQEVARLVDVREDRGANFGTDAGRLTHLGCTPVVFGPGDIAVAHKPNEWMPRAEFERTPALLGALVTRR